MFRARDAYDNECVLALAFTTYKKEGENLTYANIMHYFSEEIPDPVALGFCVESTHALNSRNLDLVWEAQLRKKLHDEIGFNIPAKTKPGVTKEPTQNWLQRILRR